jgi:hypothetical protein
MRTFDRRAFVSLCLVVICGSCKPIGRGIARGALDELEDAKHDEGLEARVHGLTDAAVGGAIDAATTAERKARLRALVDTMVDRAFESTDDNLKNKLGPSLRAEVKKAVGDALAEALSDEVKKETGELVAFLTERAIDGIGEGVENIDGKLGDGLMTALTDKVGPALDEVIRDDIRPNLKRILDEDVTPAIGKGARKAGEEAVAGAIEKLRPELKDVYAHLETVFQRGQDSIETGLYLGLAIALAVLFAAAAVQVWRTRHLSSALHLVVAEISRHSKADAVRDLATSIKHQGVGSGGGDWLSRYIDRHPSLNARKKDALPEARAV